MSATCCTAAVINNYCKSVICCSFGYVPANLLPALFKFLWYVQCLNRWWSSSCGAHQFEQSTGFKSCLLSNRL